MSTAAGFLRNRINGYVPSYFREDGEEYDIRSLLDVGCDTRQAFNAPVLELHGKERVAFVKRYFGFDAFYIDSNGKVWLAEGDFNDKEYIHHTFDTLEEMKTYFTKNSGLKLG